MVGLTLETLRDVPLLRSALEDAAERDVPVVALTVGRSVTGRPLVDAHSGALAGSDAAWEALLGSVFSALLRTHRRLEYSLVVSGARMNRSATFSRM